MSKDSPDQDASPTFPVTLLSHSTSFLCFYDNALAKMLKGIDANNLVILTVLGERNSGKSLLLNLFVRYLKCGGSGNWMNPLVRKEVSLSGFSVNSPTGPTDHHAGRINAWPEIFSMDDSSGDPRWILLLDMEEMDKPSKHERGLEKVLCLWSSVIVDCRVAKFEPDLLTTLEIVHKIALRTNLPNWETDALNVQSSRESVCSHINFVVRDFNSEGYSNSAKALDHVQRSVSKGFPNLIATFDGLKEKTAFFLKSPTKSPFLNADGFLELDPKLTNQLKTMCTKILNPDNLTIKDFGGIGVVNYMKVSVDRVNRHGDALVTELIAAGPLSNHIPNDSNDVEMIDVSKCPPIPPDLNRNPKPSNDLAASAVENRQQIHQSLHTNCTSFDSSLKAHCALTHAKLAPCDLPDEFPPVSPTASSSYACFYQLSPSSGLATSRKGTENKNEDTIPPPAPNMGNQTDKNNSVATLTPNQTPVPSYQVVPQTSLSSTKSDDKLTQSDKQTFDKLIGVKIGAIKAQYMSTMQDVDVDGVQTMHDKMLVECLSDLKKFLCGTPMPPCKKEEKLNQLQKSLELEFKRAKVRVSKDQRKPDDIPPRPMDNKHQNKTPEVETTHLEGQSNHNPQDNGTNVDNPEGIPAFPNEQVPSEMNSASHNSAAQSAHNPILDAICCEYEKMMMKELQLDKRLNISEDFFMKSHNSVVSQMYKKNLRPLLQQYGIVMEQLSEDSKAEIGNSIIAASTLYHNDVKSHNLKYSTLTQNTLSRFESQFFNMANDWVVQFCTLQTNSTKKTGQSVYNEVLRRVLNSFNVPLNLREAFNNDMKQKTNPYTSMIMNLESCLNHYQAFFEKKFEMFGCLRAEKFQEFHEEIEIIVIQKFSYKYESPLQLLRTGILTLKDQFWQRNQTIQGHEIANAEQLVPLVKNFYIEIMMELTKGKIFGKEELASLHVLVVEECLAAFTRTCNFHPFSAIPDKTPNLKNELTRLLEKYSDSNKLNIQKVQGTVSKLVNEHRTRYNDKMNDFVPARGPSVDPRQVHSWHQSTLDEMLRLLSMEIGRMEFKVPPEDYMSSLKEKIGKDWEQIQNVNSKNLEKDKEKKRELEKEAKKAEAEQKVRDQREQANSKRQPSTASVANITCSTRSSEPVKPTKSTCPENVIHTLNISDVKLPPVAIEFGLNKVRVGWKNGDRFQIVPNSLGDTDTPTTLMVTQNNDIFIGNEATNNKSHSGLGPQLFSLDKILMDPDMPYYCYINGREQRVRSEVLCGLFLSKIKSDTEKKLNGCWTIAVITIPLSFTSVQRQAMKDAAFMADFSETYLINDTSAAALYFAHTPARRDNCNGNCVLVAISRENHFDVAVYKYQEGQVVMIDSGGSLHMSRGASSGLMMFMKNTLNGIREIFGADEDKNKLRELLKELIGQDKDKIKENIYIDQSRLGSCSTTPLQNIAATYGKAIEAKETSSSIILGAAQFASLLMEHGETALESVLDKATFTYLRTGPNSRKTVMIFDPYQPLIAGKVRREDTIGRLGFSDVRIPIQEFSMDNLFPVGHLVLKPPGYEVKCPTETKVWFSLDHDGIFRVEEAYSIDQLKKRHPILHEWHSPNIKRSEVGELRKLVASIQRDEKREAFDKSKKELQQLVHEIEPQVASVKSLIGRTTLEKQIGEVQAIVSHQNSTQQMLDTKLEILNGLRSKYLAKSN